MVDRVTIIGMGLIGTSIGLGLKAAGLKGIEIVGTDMSSSASGKASKMGAVDKISHNLASSVEEARLVILAIPVMAMREVMEVIGPRLEEGCTVTDTGSTKTSVLGWAKEHLPGGVSFVGGHPMAGKEKSGPDAAEATLFRGATYCIVPGEGARPDAVKAVTNMVEALGATPLFLDAQEHDSFVAAVSHLPMVLSTILVSSVSKSPSWAEMSRLASTGFRDISRLASGDPEMHKDIFVTNPEAIVHWIDQFIKELYEFRNKVKEHREEDIMGVLIRCWETRERWVAGVPVRREPSVPMPSVATAATSLFLGERLARKQQEYLQRGKRDPFKYFRKRRPTQ